MRFASGIALVLVLTACSGRSLPPAPSSPPSAPSTAPSRGPVPQVPRTLELSGHLANPCDLLSTDDLTALGFAGNYVVIPPNPPDKNRTCEVGGGSAGGLLHLTLRTDGSPLPEAYASDPAKYEFFQARQVSGFPAAELGASAEFPVACTVSVGTGERQGMTLDHQPAGLRGTTSEICDRLLATAESVIRRLGR